MYEEFFGLSCRPFPAACRSDRYYPGCSIEAARQTLVRCVERSEGPAVIVGPSGTGKTLLCQLLAAEFNDRRYLAMLRCGSLSTRRALLQAIFHELNEPYRGMDEGELRLALADFLSDPSNRQDGLLLVVDEAHTLALRLLDELRALGNIAPQGQPRVQIILAGAGILEERLGNPRLESFAQRIAARCYLEAMQREDTLNYIAHELALCGVQPQKIFPTEACEAVYRATEGVPRLVNQVCDHAMLLAYRAGRKTVDATCVEEAWADLQQLPTPWSGDSAENGETATVIEFGGLDDDDVDESLSSPSAPVAETADCRPRLRVAAADEDAHQPLEQLEQIEETLAGLDDTFEPAGSIGPEVELVFADPGDPFSEPFAEEEIVPQRYATEAAVAQSAIELGDVIRAEVEPVRPPLPEPEEIPAPMVPPESTSAIPEEDQDLIVVEDGYEETPPPPARPVTPVRPREYRRLFAQLRHG